MSNLRVCMLSTSFPQYRDDFAGVFVYNLSRALCQRGVEVLVVAPHADRLPHYEEWDGISVYRFSYAWPPSWQHLAYRDGIPNNLRRHPWLALQAPLFLAMFLRAAWQVCADCDVVHVHWAPLAWLGLVLRWRYRIPVVLSVHGTDVRSLPSFLVQPALARVDAVIATSLEIKELLQKWGIIEPYVIHPAINEQALQPGMNPGTVAEEIGLGPGDDAVTFIGRLAEFKDPLTLIRAVPLVLAHRPQTHFVIVGDGLLADEVRIAVDTLELQHVVHLLGARGDVGRFLALSKIFVALSPVENVWSTAIAEAMHMRVPCIITRAGHTEQLFTHMKDSYLIDSKDDVQLAKAIIDLLSAEAERDRLAQGAVTLLQRHGRDSESIARRSLEMYQDVMRKRAERAIVRR